MKYVYKPTGVCIRSLSFDIENEIITNIEFVGGCPGNLKMLSKILNGWKAEDIIKMCKGNLCGIKPTSCADQLSKAIENALEEIKSYC